MNIHTTESMHGEVVQSPSEIRELDAISRARVSRLLVALDEAEKLAEEHKGCLPSFRWMRANGYAQIARWMQDSPALFDWPSLEPWMAKYRQAKTPVARFVTGVAAPRAIVLENRRRAEQEYIRNMPQFLERSRIGAEAARLRQDAKERILGGESIDEVLDFITDDPAVRYQLHKSLVGWLIHVVHKGANGTPEAAASLVAEERRSKRLKSRI